LNVREKDSWAFGDDENDLSMLRSAGRGYLMKNAASHLHNQGFEIVDDLIQVIETIITTHRFQL
jgi:hydroxymethylpyrimidine pyrophosphatase-like HAD family hydrolase